MKEMTWNILALNPIHRYKKEKLTIEDNTERNKKIINKIKESKADIILLQELDKHFINTWESEKLTTHKLMYDFYPKQDSEKEKCVFDCDFTTGIIYNTSYTCISKLFLYDPGMKYDRKNAFILTLERDKKLYRFASLHCSGRNKKANEALITDVKIILMDNTLGKPLDLAVYGGDFNKNLTDEFIKTLKKQLNNTQDESIKKKMNQKLKEYENHHTTCNFDYSDEELKIIIDDIRLCHGEYSMSEKTYHEGKCEYPSDHFPVSVVFNKKLKI